MKWKYLKWVIEKGVESKYINLEDDVCIEFTVNENRNGNIVKKKYRSNALGITFFKNKVYITNDVHNTGESEK